MCGLKVSSAIFRGELKDQRTNISTSVCWCIRHDQYVTQKLAKILALVWQILCFGAAGIICRICALKHHAAE
jgi:hypothetical protein